MNFPLIRRRHNQDPFSLDLDISRIFDDFFKTPFGFGVEKIPAVDVYEKDDKVFAKVEIPGAKPEDIRLQVDGNLLIISGEKKQERETKKEDYYRLESAYGRFQRVVELPAEVKPEDAKATYKNGVLKVEFTRAEKQNKKDIRIDIN